MHTMDAEHYDLALKLAAGMVTFLIAGYCFVIWLAWNKDKSLATAITIGTASLYPDFKGVIITFTVLTIIALEITNFFTDEVS